MERGVDLKEASRHPLGAGPPPHIFKGCSDTPEPPTTPFSREEKFINRAALDLNYRKIPTGELHGRIVSTRVGTRCHADIVFLIIQL